MNPGYFIGAGVTVLLFLIGQTAAGIWWAAKISTEARYTRERLQEIGETVKQLAGERFTQQEAKEAMALVHQRLDKLEERTRFVEQAMAERLQRSPR